MIIDRSKLTHECPWGKLESCELCGGALLCEYSLGMQLFTFTCQACVTEDEKPRYEVLFFWGEHVGQDHKWLRFIIDENGVEHKDEETIINTAQ